MMKNSPFLLSYKIILILYNIFLMTPVQTGYYTGQHRILLAPLTADDFHFQLYRRLLKQELYQRS